MKYFSMFTGIGGFEKGIGDEHECIGFSEIDKYAISVYKFHFPNHVNYGDATKIDPANLPDFDLLTGGFPCQAFSIAGKRKGFDDTRGTLFFDIARIVKEKHPKYLLLENVKGLLSHDEGRTFKTILATLDELRYDLQWQVLNAKNFGVPQNRERVFIIGHLRGEPRPEVFPIGEDGQLSTNNNKKSEAQITPSLKATNQYMKSDDQYIQYVRFNRHQQYRTVDAAGIAPCMPSQRNDKINIEFENARIRRLTPLECERLMGFPDNWTQYGEGNIRISDTQRYKMCGNAVVVNVVKEIVKRLIQ